MLLRNRICSGVFSVLVNTKSRLCPRRVRLGQGEIGALRDINDVGFTRSFKHQNRPNAILKIDIFCQRNSYLLKTMRHNSTIFVNSDNLKLELYLRNITVDVLLSKFNINRDEPIFQLIADKVLLEENLQQSKELKESLETLKTLKENEGKDTKDEKEMLILAEEDIKKYTERLKEVYAELIEDLIPKEQFHDCEDVVLEIAPGVGGSEAMLFAAELRSMYCNYLKYKGWEYTIAENDETELGGVRHCSLLVSGPGAYRTLQHEAGVHRVQRVPATEKGGRVHTSTVSVAVLPQPSEIEVDIKESDLKIETKRASGAGGQHVNTTDSAVRVTHIPTGIIVECQSGRSQHQNKATALSRLRAKIYERELNQADSSIRSHRKQQVGTSGRSEKIRTYNFRDDRISDHRLSMNIHNLKEVMSNGESLEKLLKLLEKWHHGHKLKQFIDTLPMPL